ncbi:hypothetical protein HHI36_007074 [Cryptolaemus montrouzieri]|uniref:Uncharacterized protein n=1 Tax=Cryptolaemus montrouzieri TaxID=559131 RepID=A0ABD2MNI8_9CUCU
MSIGPDNPKNKLCRLKDFEKKLERLLPKVDQEINQTEVEWLHLKSLIEKYNNLESRQGSKPSDINTSDPICLKAEFDNGSINSNDLDLSLHSTFKMATHEEEFDTDSD